MSRPRYAPPLVVDGRFPVALATVQDRVAVGSEEEWRALDFDETAALARLRFGAFRLCLSGGDETLAGALASSWGAFLEADGTDLSAAPEHARIALRAVDRLHFVSPVAVPATARRGSRLLVKMRGLAMVLDAAEGRASAIIERAFPRQDLANLLRTALAAFSWNQGEWLLRAAAVEQGGRAILLVGPAHAGKSTAARLAAPRPVLSDDAVLVRVRDGQALMATAGLWGMEGSEGLERSRAAQELPVAALVLLAKAPVNRLTRVRGAGAALALLTALATLPGERAAAQAALAFAESLAAAVPVYRLEFHHRDGSFWEPVAAAAEGGVGGGTL